MRKFFFKNFTSLMILYIIIIICIVMINKKDTLNVQGILDQHMIHQKTILVQFELSKPSVELASIK